MEIEKLGNNTRTPSKSNRTSQGQEQKNLPPIIIQDDSPVLEYIQPSKSDLMKDSRSTLIDEHSEKNSIFPEKKFENNNIFSTFGGLKINEFNKHLENIKIHSNNFEKENLISQNIIEINKQLQGKNMNRDMNMQESLNQQKFNELGLFKDNQQEEFKIKMKQKDMQLSQKEEENADLLRKIKNLEQLKSMNESELIELKQNNKKQLQFIEEQKSVFEKKLLKVQSNQDFTSDINGDWKAQMLEQKQQVEDLERKVLLLENKLERTEMENQSMAEKNMELNNENYDLKEDLDKSKRDYQLLKAQKRQEEGIFDEYGTQQNKFIGSLISYQKDLKDVFDQINNNPIIEKYKKQNDELLIENTSLREQVIKLSQELSEQHLEEIKKKRGSEGDTMNCMEDESTKSNALMLYESMMQKFTEMDERMVQNDNEKFEALQQKDFWFGKSQTLENEVTQLRESNKLLNAKLDELESMLQNTKTTNKKNNIANANNNKTKKRKAAGKDSDVEEESANITDKKIKPNLEFELSPSNSIQHTVSTNNHKIVDNIIEKEPTHLPVQQKPTQISTPSLPAKNMALFTLRICNKCNLNIKKMQEFESCTTCKKDYHSKCKGESVVGAFCHSCYDKQKKKTNIEMEVEKQQDSQQQDMIEEK